MSAIIYLRVDNEPQYMTKSVLTMWKPAWKSWLRSSDAVPTCRVRIHPPWSVRLLRRQLAVVTKALFPSAVSWAG